MFDVFTEEIEVLLKDGIANLYWYKKDLHKAWLRSGVPQSIINKISKLTDSEERKLSKRQQMDHLYITLRNSDYNRRLEVSRCFARILMEHQNFTAQDEKHKIEKAYRIALELKEHLRKQKNDLEHREQIRRRAIKTKKETYPSKLTKIKDNFESYIKLKPQARGYALEKLFPELMKISEIPVHKPFKIIGEQIDGAIKYDGHYYLIELKWTEKQIGPSAIGAFHYKVSGKLGQLGIMISMGGYTDGVIKSINQGKELKVMLLDGIHFSRVIYNIYTFNELLEHCISHASIKGETFCPHLITK